jgi:protein-disulfide isomerase
VESPVVAANGRIVVVKFTDYQCPACAQTDVLYEPIFAKFAVTHPGMVQLVTMDYPLDPECNEFTPNGSHQSACEAAAAVRLAGGVGSVEVARMQEWLYANQEAMTREAVIAALRDIAGVDNFDARYAATVEEVKSDIRAGAALPVEATPTFVINGVLVKGGLAPEFFERAIARELEP